MVDMLIMTEKLLQEAFDVDRAYVYIVDEKRKEVVRYISIDDECEERRFPMDSGLVGLALQKKEIMSIPDAYRHEAFNGMIDIDTTMPILIKPIMATEVQNKQD